MTPAVQPIPPSLPARNPLWDVARGLGMVFVVAGHGFGGGISRFVNLFHIPLFFFVSGLVFKFADRSPSAAFVFLRKSFKSLWRPSLLYGTALVLLHNLLVLCHVYDLAPYGLRQTAVAIAKHAAFLKTEPLESAFWFLSALFVARVLLYAVSWVGDAMASTVARSAAELALVALVFAAGAAAARFRINLPANADVACSLLPFLYAGFRLKKADLSRFWPFLPALAVLVALFFSGHTLRMSRNQIVSPFFLLLSGSAGIAATLSFSALLCKYSPLARTVSFVGRHTIPILCLHLLAFRLVSWVWMVSADLPSGALARHPIVGPSIAWGLAYTAAGLLLPLAVPLVHNLFHKNERTSA